MTLGVLLAVAAAACSGVAALLQSAGAARMARYRAMDPRLLVALVCCPPYLLGLALDGGSFALSVAALRGAPLFVVQAAGAASVAVVAVLSATVLRRRLPNREWIAVGAVFAGVAMLAVSGNSGAPVPLSGGARWALLGAAVGMGMLSLATPRRLGGAAVPGLLAGLTYGDSAVASRVIGPFARPGTGLLTSPVAWAVVVAGLMGTLLYASALQRGSVTSATGMSTIGQTIAPAAVGLFVLGDRLRPGLEALAGVGFALAVLGAVLLARHAGHHQKPATEAVPAGARADPPGTAVAGTVADARERAPTGPPGAPEPDVVGPIGPVDPGAAGPAASIEPDITGPIGPVEPVGPEPVGSGTGHGRPAIDPAGLASDPVEPDEGPAAPEAGVAG